LLHRVFIYKFGSASCLSLLSCRLSVLLWKVHFQQYRCIFQSQLYRRDARSQNRLDASIVESHQNQSSLSAGRCNNWVRTAFCELVLQPRNCVPTLLQVFTYTSGNVLVGKEMYRVISRQAASNLMRSMSSFFSAGYSLIIAVLLYPAFMYPVIALIGILVPEKTSCEDCK